MLLSNRLLVFALNPQTAFWSDSKNKATIQSTRLEPRQEQLCRSSLTRKYPFIQSPPVHLRSSVPSSAGQVGGNIKRESSALWQSECERGGRAVLSSSSIVGCSFNWMHQIMAVNSFLTPQNSFADKVAQYKGWETDLLRQQPRSRRLIWQIWKQRDPNLLCLHVQWFPFYFVIKAWKNMLFCGRRALWIKGVC